MLPTSKVWLSNHVLTIPQIERMNKRPGSVDLCFRVMVSKSHHAHAKTGFGVDRILAM